MIGLAATLLRRKRRAAARVAVQLRQDEAVDIERLVEAGRDVDRFLARHRVQDEQNLGRAHGGLDALQLVHQLGVDLKAASGVDDDDISPGLFGFRDAAPRDLGGIDFVAEREDRGFHLLADDLQLFDGRRSVHVRRDEHRVTALFA